MVTPSITSLNVAVTAAVNGTEAAPLPGFVVVIAGGCRVNTAAWNDLDDAEVVAMVRRRRVVDHDGGSTPLDEELISRCTQYVSEDGARY